MKIIKIGTYQISENMFKSLSAKSLKKMGATQVEILRIAKEINDVSKLPKETLKETQKEKEVKVEKKIKKDE